MNNEIEAYINNVPTERRERFRGIMETIKHNVPQAESVIKYKMPTFQVGDAWLAVANKKNYISIYTCESDKIAVFKQKYPKIKTGATCVNIRDTDDFELKDLAAITKAIFR
ncbi:MAG: DUF1801 domain-containing protein [Acidobacteriota bacterium]|nr:DUF1801 domain-containing protein [Acidobacteriota bacterium]